MTDSRVRIHVGTAMVLVGLLAGCAAPEPAPRKPALAGIDHIVVIYAENRSFDNLYGLFPGANGIANATPATYRQVDRDGSALPRLPPVWKGKDPDPAFPRDLPNRPFRIDAAPVNLPLSVADARRDPQVLPEPGTDQRRPQRPLCRRDATPARSRWATTTARRCRCGRWARDYVLADNFFMGAFGGSYLNHFWLICACTPEDRNAPAALHAQVDERGWLKTKPESPASVLSRPPAFLDGDVTPDGYSVNTTQPPWQPSRVPPAKDGDPRGTDPRQHTLPPQTLTTIGDTLTAKGVTWAWYAGAWNAALKDGMQPPDAPRKVMATLANGAPYFVTHHQPFNYFARFAPGTADRERHLKDYTDLAAGIAEGSLPQVVFYKPQGTLNEHPGYADVLTGDQHIADLVAKIKASPLWASTAIIVTYDENGGFWDHVRAAAGRPLGSGHAHSDDHHFAVCEARLRRPHAVRHDVDPQAHHAALRPRRRCPGVRPGAGDLTAAFE